MRVVLERIRDGKLLEQTATGDDDSRLLSTLMIANQAAMKGTVQTCKEMDSCVGMVSKIRRFLYK